MIDTSYAVLVKRNTLTSPLKTDLVKNTESDYEKTEDQDSDENDENDENDEIEENNL